MLICHKLMSRVERRYCKECLSYVRRESPCNLHVTIAMSIMPASWEVCHWAPHPVFSVISGLSAATHHRCETQLSYPWKLHACRANNNYFLYIFFNFCSLYFVLFSILLYRTIVAVYTDNIFLYNYLRQMHQIINLSPVGCFTPARGKTLQKKSWWKRGYPSI